MEHPYGLLSIVPPLVAIVLAIVTRRPVVSLLLGIFCGALVTTGGNPITALADTCEVHLWPTLIDPGKMRVFAFTLLMAGMIGVISRCGGMQGLIRLITPLAKSQRSGQLTTWFLGLVIFFDDYANTILLGNTLRPVCDRLKISREKLAYIVDSTAAPVASLALLSTWIAVEVDYIGEGIEGIGEATDLKAMELFISSIPYRFYAWMALLLVPLVAVTGRDFGPMWKKERERRLQPTDQFDSVESDADNLVRDPALQRWYNAVLPIAITLIVVLYLLYVTGKSGLGLTAQDAAPALRDILGAADSSLALQYGSLAGLAVAALLCRFQGLLDGKQILQATGKGMKVVLPAIAILWCASALSRMTGNKSFDGKSAEVSSVSLQPKSLTSNPFPFEDHRLYTGDFLAAQILPTESQTKDGEAEGAEVADATVLKLLPTAIFALAAVLAFSTGTSFGTMGLLMPMSVTLVSGLLASQTGTLDPTDPILLGCVASVLSGAVLGDHCSPISDTTILSSQACTCDHISHVVTQMPYAMAAGFVSIVLGTLPLGWGVSVWLLLPLQFVTLLIILRLFGKKVDEES